MKKQIIDEKRQYDTNRKAVKISALSSGKIDKCEYFTVGAILPSDQGRIKEHAKFTYFLLAKSFEKQIKTIEDQGEKQIKALQEHEKELVKSSSGKKSLAFLKQKEIFQELTNEKIDEIQTLSKHIDFNNLVYYFKGESGSKNFISFRGPLNFYKNIKNDHTSLEKAEKNKKN